MALKACFGEGEKAAIRQAELLSRKRLPGETPTELGGAISILTAKAFRGALEATYHSIGDRAFLAALSPRLSQRVEF